MESSDEIFTEKNLLGQCWDKNLQVSVNDVANAKLAKYIEDEASIKGFPPMFQHAVFLSTVSHCMGKAECSIIPNSWNEPCVMYILVIAQTGMNKTGASRDAIQMVMNIEKMNENDYRNKLYKQIDDIIKEQNDDVVKEKEQNDDAVKEKEKEDKEKDGEPGDEEEEEEEEEEEDELPASKRRKIEDLKTKIAAIKSEWYQNYVCNISPQKLKCELAKGSGNCMLVADEGSSFLKQLAQNGSTGDMKSTFVSLFGAESIRYSTQKSGTIECKDPRVQFLGFIQGDLLLKHMTMSDDRVGLDDRFVYICAKPTVRDVRKMVTASHSSQLNATKLIEGIYYSHQTKRTYTLDEAARETFFKITEENNAMIDRDPTNSRLRGMCRKNETNILRGALINAGIRGGIEFLNNEEKLPKEERWVNANLEKMTGEKKAERAMRGRTYTVNQDDMAKSVTLQQKHSLEIYKIFSHFSEELFKLSKKSGVCTVSKGSCAARVLGDPTSVTSEYAIKHFKHIENIYHLELDENKIEGCLKKVSSARYFPQVRVQGGNQEKSKYFLKALNHLGILTYNEADNTIVKKTANDKDGLSEETLLMFEEIKKRTDDGFNPLDL